MNALMAFCRIHTAFEEIVAPAGVYAVRLVLPTNCPANRGRPTCPPTSAVSWRRRVIRRDHAVVRQVSRREVHRKTWQALRLRIDHNAVSFAFVSSRHTVAETSTGVMAPASGSSTALQLFGRKGRKVLSCHTGFLIAPR